MSSDEDIGVEEEQPVVNSPGSSPHVDPDAEEQHREDVMSEIDEEKFCPTSVDCELEIAMRRRLVSAFTPHNIVRRLFSKLVCHLNSVKVCSSLSYLFEANMQARHYESNMEIIVDALHMICDLERNCSTAGLDVGYMKGLILPIASELIANVTEDVTEFVAAGEECLSLCERLKQNSTERVGRVFECIRGHSDGSPPVHYVDFGFRDWFKTHGRFCYIGQLNKIVKVIDEAHARNMYQSYFVDNLCVQDEDDGPLPSLSALEAYVQGLHAVMTMLIRGTSFRTLSFAHQWKQLNAQPLIPSETIGRIDRSNKLASEVMLALRDLLMTIRGENESWRLYHACLDSTAQMQVPLNHTHQQDVLAFVENMEAHEKRCMMTLLGTSSISSESPPWIMNKIKNLMLHRKRQKRGRIGKK